MRPHKIIVAKEPNKSNVTFTYTLSSVPRPTPKRLLKCFFLFLFYCRCFVLSDSNRKTTKHPFQRVRGNHWYFKPAHTSAKNLFCSQIHFQDLQTMDSCLDKFLKYLEDACNRVRPAYDGVILLCYEQVNILKKF